MTLFQRTLAKFGLGGGWLLTRLTRESAMEHAMTDAQARTHFGVEDEHAETRAVVRHFHDWLLATLRERAGESIAAGAVLDVGDSDGLLLKHLGKSGTGLNINPQCIAQARANGIEAVEADLHALPFPNDSFEIVLCFETLEHATSPYQALTELARVCRSDGRIFISVPRVRGSRVVPSLGLDEQHVFELADRDLRALLTHTSLEVVWTTTFAALSRPVSVAERIVNWAWRREDLVNGVFVRFAFYELAARTG